MFENIEIRKVENGFILVVNEANEESKEYVYDSGRKALRTLKGYIDPKGKNEAPAD